MHKGKEQPRWGPTLFMAMTGFKHEMLRIYLSDVDAPLEEPSLGIKERSCVNGMLVIITSAEIS